jgi:hypothetical protein
MIVREAGVVAHIVKATTRTSSSGSVSSSSSSTAFRHCLHRYRHCLHHRKRLRQHRSLFLQLRRPQDAPAGAVQEARQRQHLAPLLEVHHRRRGRLGMQEPLPLELGLLLGGHRVVKRRRSRSRRRRRW